MQVSLDCRINLPRGGAGPARRVYRITDVGWERLGFWRHDIEMRLANLQYFLETYHALEKRDTP
ncbi:MAG: hypothetical protein FPO08_07890 [Geobacter sp.]|nr:MAG: hypothetical protein FPO08_07890 [Geobacter sp.]